MMKTMLTEYRNIPQRLLSVLGDAARLCPFVIRAYGSGDEKKTLMFVSRIENGDAFGWYLDDVSEEKQTIRQLASLARKNAMIRAELSDDEKELFRNYEEKVSLGTFPFGKYKGQTVEEVMVNDLGYVLWASENSSSFIEQIASRVNLTVK